MSSINLTQKEHSHHPWYVTNSQDDIAVSSNNNTIPTTSVITYPITFTESITVYATELEDYSTNITTSTLKNTSTSGTETVTFKKTQITTKAKKSILPIATSVRAIIMANCAETEVEPFAVEMAQSDFDESYLTDWSSDDPTAPLTGVNI